MHVGNKTIAVAERRAPSSSSFSNRPRLVSSQPAEACVARTVTFRSPMLGSENEIFE
jgi:hypothetical protein